jgi:hypothetical protein
MSTRAFTNPHHQPFTDTHRAIARSAAAPLHLGDWLLTLVSAAVLGSSYLLLLEVLDRDQVGALGWGSLILGLLLLVGGAGLRRLETRLFSRAPGPRDALLVAVNGAVLVLGAVVVLLPRYV